MHWILTFILGFIAGAGVFLIWLFRLAARIEDKQRQERVDALTGKKREENHK